MKRLISILLTSILLISACAKNSLPSGTSTVAPASPIPSSTSTRVAPVTPPTPTLTLFPTLTSFPTPIPHAMSIAALRAGNYSGSEIFIEDELDRGANYRRYYAFYLSEGYKIYALLTVPDGEMPPDGWPAIVFNHGYIPPDEYRTTERYINYVDRIALSGYIVFRIDYRGHDNSQGESRGAYGDPGYAVDVLNAVASIKQFAQANPERIGMWGHSMGGFLTLRAMVATSDVKVGVIWAGVVAPYSDLLYNWRRTGSFTPSPSSRGVGWRTEWVQQFGTPQENPQFWDSVSANTYLADISGPLQLHHGGADEDVPIMFSENLALHLNSLHLPYEFYIYESDNHNISNYFTLAMDRTIAYFDLYLK